MTVAATLRSDLRINTDGIANMARPVDVVDLLMQAGMEFAGPHDFAVPADGTLITLAGIAPLINVQLVSLRNTGTYEFYIDMRSRGLGSNVVRLQVGGCITMFNVLPKDNDPATPQSMDFSKWNIFCKDAQASRGSFIYVQG